MKKILLVLSLLIYVGSLVFLGVRWNARHALLEPQYEFRTGLDGAVLYRCDRASGRAWQANGRDLRWRPLTEYGEQVPLDFTPLPTNHPPMAANH